MSEVITTALEGNMPPARKFKDARGDEWVVTINVNTVQRLIDELQYDIRRTVEQEFEGLRRLYYDDLLLGQVLCVILEKQLLAKEVPADEFAERLLGDALAHGCSAVALAITDFFRDRRVRETARGVIEKLEAVIDQTVQLAAARGNADLAKIDAAQLAQQWIGSFGNPPGSSS
ncbi:MAG: hypothetical protein K8U03_09215 [Planctomycetia bacterium]|nr:hypothetical protein [Planctomycetia bacterium]